MVCGKVGRKEWHFLMIRNENPKGSFNQSENCTSIYSCNLITKERFSLLEKHRNSCFRGMQSIN